MLRGKFVALDAYMKNEEKSQINKLSSHLKSIDNKEQK